MHLARASLRGSRLSNAPNGPLFQSPIENATATLTHKTHTVLGAEANASLAVLQARAMHVSVERRGRIGMCRDKALLDLWTVRAATTVEDVLADELSCAPDERAGSTFVLKIELNSSDHSAVG